MALATTETSAAAETTTTTAAPTTTPQPADVLPDSAKAQLQSVVDATIARYGGEAAIAISNGNTTLSAGDISVPSAWSTIKVPIAIAALRANNSANTQQLARAAIVNSDNNAARSLYGQLGDSTTAAATVDTILAEGGNASIHTQPRTIRPPYTSFGQTNWPVPDAANFAAHLPCFSGSHQVRSYMQNITNGGDYGLGTLSGVGFKGGWGPDASGKYLVRQMGFLQLTDGSTVGIAIASLPSAGSYGAGQGALTQLASGVKDLLPTASGLRCQ